MLRTIKLDSAEFHGLFTPELHKLIELFEKYEFELRIAGGAVRDLLNGQCPHDIDLATTATPTEMKAMFEAEGVRLVNAGGEKHGTITARIDDKDPNFECTTLRIDVRTDGRHAEVEFTRDWKLDSLRRDLTVNSMFLGFDGTVYDYFNGIEDLKNHRVCFVGDAADRIQEDYLRILRYFRFFGRIAVDADSHEEATLHTIKENMDGLSRIAGERLWVELKKILVGRHAASLIPTMFSLGMAQYIGIPDEVNSGEWGAVSERCLPLHPEPTTMLAACLHTGKQLLTFNERLKISRHELQNAAFIISHRDKSLQTLQLAKDLLFENYKEPRAKDKICELLKYLGHASLLTEFAGWELPKFPITGFMLLENGVPKGPGLAKTLDMLRKIWKESDYKYSKTELLEFLNSSDNTEKT